MVGLHAEGTLEVPDSGLWVVGLGASAGGVEALRQLLPVLPDGPVAYVVAQHMSPVHPSLLLQVLSRETSLKVVEVFDGIALEPGHVYVAPPNCDVSLAGGVLRIQTAAPRISPQPSIDVLFDSLAAGLPGRVIGVSTFGPTTWAKRSTVSCTSDWPRKPLQNDSISTRSRR